MAYSNQIDCPTIDQAGKSCPGKIAWDRAECTVCGGHVIPPNVRWAAAVNRELNERYSDALTGIRAQGLGYLIAPLESVVRDAKAIFAVPLEFAPQQFRGNTLHQNYHGSVEAGDRQSASRDDDLFRRTVDSSLFGSIAREITMAALSLNGRGMRSYGTIFLEFKDIVCSNRASLLIDNSFTFFKRYPGGPTMFPLGYRATWNDRSKLAVIKLHEKLNYGLPVNTYVEHLLSDTGDRQTDEFIEVHIYGRWDHQAIERVRGATIAASGSERVYLIELKARLGSLGIFWEDFP